MLRFLIKGKTYEISKTVLKQQMKSAQNNQLDKKNSIQLPTWVENQQFEPIYEYLIFVNQIQQLPLEKRDEKVIELLNCTITQFPQLNTTKKLIQIMRISDYLTLEKFQQHFIQQCVIKALNQQNCINYLEETHKKLKNSTSGVGTAQAWYSLLNACIDFISYNLTDVYLAQPERIQKLHEKILGQILDRTIKCQNVLTSKGPMTPTPKHSQSSGNSKEKQIIFNLLMKSKKVNSVDALCNSLKGNLLHKKINKKMHAKLSWKLHDMNQILDKKVKNFKFLELNWILEAVRVRDGCLKIRLSLLPQQDIKSSPNSTHIGVFYSKLYWTMEKQLGSSKASSSTSGVGTQIQQNEIPSDLSGQQPLSINYICFKNPISIEIFNISNEFEKKSINRKLQLSIYCSIDQCYSFVINYVINEYSKLRLDEKKIEKDQIYALIEGSKASGKYSQAVWLIKYLAKNQLEIPLVLLDNLPYDKLPTYEVQFIKKLVRNDNSVLDEVFGKKQQSYKLVSAQNQLNSLSGSKVSDNIQTKSNNSRAPSRGRHKKIFAESPQKDTPSIIPPELGSIQNNTLNVSISPIVQQSRPASQAKRSQEPQIVKSQEDLELQEMLRVADIKNYFYDKNSPILAML